MLRALDLFSGIGGITYGLRGIVTPVAYVEKNKDAREFLQKKHPDVPVFDDVCAFDATEWKGKVDIITGGWPCTGFSIAGKGAGFEHEASGLFSEVVRITNECEPRYLFLENSHILSKKTNVSVVVNALDKLGYDCKWLTCRATNVGAPHQRHRWFCLVIKRGASVITDLPLVDTFNWSSGEPDKQIKNYTPINRTVSSWLGNAVVPDQVRYAFTTLNTMSTEIATYQHDINKFQNCGFSLKSEIYWSRIKIQERPPLYITLTQENPPNKHKATTPHIKTITKKFWSTPVFSHNPSGVNFLTYRSSKLLGTQVKFAEGGFAGMYVNPDWVRWLMGYPEDYFTLAYKDHETQS
ncbi:cytosine-specific methyltransferase [Paramecium bursaria Chlorella virus CVR-1]|uniref:Cytosine-specific methyltransferase n=1 Tax=Paramecium bursaria Chlorella virus CVA-1 TaxID=42683 RepID=M1HKH3_9PHYC|nr:DNA methyltransferase [Paramecium bursaria Chlorella virus CVA-1]AGE48979.1 cytosine-specific methyltransferase [Paramecium bursaria Chlorella virus AP110A]AGE49999.1 cytosine-specific methyltransferase [Paramecium bursaria Chlorella virus Can18-4]AGE50664.1 cytosine-specific methyltransferase [Paramecium bursaria Chlorella virus CVA-1]AGE52342.1 cytosine-specific methyltransferase [Paramecium bursaria Chlorella virus CVR-1]